MGTFAHQVLMACCSVAALGLLPALPAMGDDTVFAQLPRETLVAARVARLEALDDTLKPLAANFGIAFPPLGTLASQVDGVDPAGEAVVGVAAYREGEYLPFVLLPVSDYRALVRAGDGDAGIEVTPLTLSGEELLACQRGKWAMVTNVVDEFALLGRLDAEQVEQVASHVGNELLTVLLTDAGLEEIKAMAERSGVSARQVASRRRVLASRPWNWRNLQEWRERLVLHQDMVQRLHSHCASLLLAIDTNDQLRTRIEAILIPREEVAAREASGGRVPLQLANERTVATAACDWDSPWVEWLVQMHLSSFSNGSDEIGVDYFRGGEFEKFRQTVAVASDQIESLRFLMIAPGNSEPTMSNSALLVTVSDSSEFLVAVNETMVTWNRMIQTARRSIDFVYEIKPLTVDQRVGKRYSIDLPTAFRQDNVPEVREVLADMYGRNGVWAMDVLPLDETHVLVSDLPDKLRDQLMKQWEATAATAAEEPHGGWAIQLHPDVLQDWLNDVRRHNFGENVVGWKPKPLNSTGDIVIGLTTHEKILTIKTEIAGDVVQAFGELVRGE